MSNCYGLLNIKMRLFDSDNLYHVVIYKMRFNNAYDDNLKKERSLQTNVYKLYWMTGFNESK